MVQALEQKGRGQNQSEAAKDPNQVERSEPPLHTRA